MEIKEKSSTVHVDVAKCRTCESKACIDACKKYARGILELKDGAPSVGHLTKDEVLRYIDTSIGQIPEIATREINTAVLVDDGQTVVIGGVYEFTDANSVAKVPFLGDVPFLGNLFKKRSRSKEKAELLIFLTPKVMRVEKRA